MRGDIAEKWINELLSGQYKQGRGVLKKDDDGEISYCCLGVLCELYGKEHGIESIFIKSGNMNLAIVPGHPHTGIALTVLPEPITKWAGMKSNEGILNENDCLTGLNDSGHTFEQIAEVIKNNMEVL